jgi:hypothetical protein
MSLKMATLKSRKEIMIDLDFWEIGCEGGRYCGWLRILSSCMLWC